MKKEIVSFLASLRTRAASEHTVLNYGRDLERFENAPVDKSFDIRQRGGDADMADLALLHDALHDLDQCLGLEGPG